MLTPQNFREKAFEKAIFGGYDTSSVDDFLDEAANDYAALAKENMPQGLSGWALSLCAVPL